jgi:hypothetical protein
MNEPIINLINYLRKLSRQNIFIKSFGVGELYELDEVSNFEYPLLFLELPITSEINVEDVTKLNLTFNLHSFTNIITDTNGNNRQVTEAMIGKITNQINYSDLALQDNLMNNAFKILAIICSKIAQDALNSDVIVDGRDIPMVVESISISNAERVTNKDLYQSTATISIIIENSYYCPLDSYFDYNII